MTLNNHIFSMSAGAFGSSAAVAFGGIASGDNIAAGVGIMAYGTFGVCANLVGYSRNPEFKLSSCFAGVVLGLVTAAGITCLVKANDPIFSAKGQVETGSLLAAEF